jgi:hypothetical protein
MPAGGRARVTAGTRHGPFGIKQPVARVRRPAARNWGRGHRVTGAGWGRRPRPAGRPWPGPRRPASRRAAPVHRARRSGRPLGGRGRWRPRRPPPGGQGSSAGPAYLAAEDDQAGVEDHADRGDSDRDPLREVIEERGRHGGRGHGGRGVRGHGGRGGRGHGGRGGRGHGTSTAPRSRCRRLTAWRPRWPSSSPSSC